MIRWELQSWPRHADHVGHDNTVVKHEHKEGIDPMKIMEPNNQPLDDHDDSILALMPHPFCKVIDRAVLDERQQVGVDIRACVTGCHRHVTHVLSCWPALPAFVRIAGEYRAPG